MMTTGGSSTPASVLAMRDIMDAGLASATALGVLFQNSGFGTVNARQNTQSSTIIDGYRYNNGLSAIAAGSPAGVDSTGSANPYFDTQGNWTIWIAFCTPASLGGLRYYGGPIATAPTGLVDEPPVNSIVARFISGVDTKLNALARGAGSASTPIPFGPTLAVNTPHMLRIRFDATLQKAYFGCYAGQSLVGDFGEEVEVTANLPAAGATMGFVSAAYVLSSGSIRWPNRRICAVPICVTK